MRGMAGFVWFVCVAPVFAASPADLAIQARAVLKKHCAECHNGDKPDTLDILDFDALTNPKRSPLPAFFAAGKPQASQLLQLIADGSMPPGRRPRLSSEEFNAVLSWIESGLAIPKQFDEATTLEWLARDAEQLPEAERATTRYFTLHHLISETAPAELEPTREALRSALARVSAGEAKLTPVDPTQTLFRFDLRSAGWDAKPFRELNLEDSTPKRPVKFDLFDLVLLEYPLGVPLERNELGDRVLNTFVKLSGQVRPLPYVRADWFAAAIADPRLTADLRSLLMLAGDAPPRPSFPRGFPANPFLVPTPDGGIPAIDGRFNPDPVPREPYGLELRVLDRFGEAATKFKPGDGIIPQVSAEVVGWFELIWPGTDGDIFQFNLTEFNRDRIDPQKPTTIYVADNASKLPFPISKDTPPGMEKLVVFFAGHGLPKGVRIQAPTKGKPITRFYHHLLADDPTTFRRIARKTTTFEITKPKE